MFRELHLPFASPRLWCDNISAIFIASNPVYQQRMRHVEVDYHHIREKVTRKEIIVGYVFSIDQVADLLTKGLSAIRFSFLLSKLLVRGHTVSLWGSDKPSLIPISAEQYTPIWTRLILKINPSPSSTLSSSLVLIVYYVFYIPLPHGLLCIIPININAQCLAHY